MELEITSELVPVTHVALEITAAELAKAVANHQTHVDDIGRVCFDRGTARQVIADHRATQAAIQEKNAREQARLVEYAAQLSPVGRGIPASGASALDDVRASEPGPQFTQHGPQSQLTALTPVQLLAAKAAKAATR